jgi:site-specific DNA-adenine methylase
MTPEEAAMSLSAPFPWFGGKAMIADIVWQALGPVDHYVEPFFGSGAVLLARPDQPGVETVNDADGLLANFWRSVQSDPAAVAAHADWPTNEADLHARHLWLVGKRQSLTERLMGDETFFDAKAAGWWLWGLCSWIGSGWCSGKGPWISDNGRLVDSRERPDLKGTGQGINRKLPHLGDAGRGIRRKLPRLGHGRSRFILDWMDALADRLRDVRVACGDWSRVIGPGVLRAGDGICGIFLDPPYAVDERAKVYAHESDAARECLEWCIANGHNPELRIVLAGYAGEHDALERAGWHVKAWKARGGYGSQGEDRGRDNSARERLWLSPHCLGRSVNLFGEAA